MILKDINLQYLIQLTWNLLINTLKCKLISKYKNAELTLYELIQFLSYEQWFNSYTFLQQKFNKFYAKILKNATRYLVLM